MKKYLVLATLFLMTSTASAANITWHGGVDYRYNKLDFNDNLGTTTAVNNGTQSISELEVKSHMYRMNLGAKGGWDNIEWGITVGTTGNGGLGNARPNSDWVTVQTNTSNIQGDLAIGVQEAWFRYGNDWGFGDIGLTFGRQALPFAMGSGQVFFDQDVRLDGFSQTWKFGSFGLNLGQYILGSVNGNAPAASVFADRPADEATVTNQDGFSALFGLQGTFDWRFNDDFNMMFAVGHYNWSRTLGTRFQNFIPNTNNAANINNVEAVARTSQENSRHWQFLLDFDLPYMLNLEFELVLNRELAYGVPAVIGQTFQPGTDAAGTTINFQDTTAWTIGISYGELKKSQDFTIGYAYQDKGLGAVTNAFTYEFHPAGYKGHHIWAGYNLANNFNMGLKFIWLDEKDPRNQAGNVLTTAEKIDRNYWELTTGIHF